MKVAVLGSGGWGTALAPNNRNYIRLAIRDRKDNHTLVEALKRYI